MSDRELERGQVLAQVAMGHLRLRAAAGLLQVSYRQAKRLWQRYQAGGVTALRHRLLGRPSNRAWAPTVREAALAFVAAELGGHAELGVGQRFGPTLAAEHVAGEAQLAVPVTTLRRWMQAAGLWTRRRADGVPRTRRERARHFGELVQLDGSTHAWFEGRAAACCLFAMVDDATGRTVQHFAAGETTWGAIAVLRAWVAQYGIPRALYVDGLAVYRRPTDRQRRKGPMPTDGSQFARLCEQLGIRLIVAASPQAKGRVERAHGTHQDRLVKKMRRIRVRTIAGGNAFLETYLAEHNARFAVPPAQPTDWHRAAPTGAAFAALWQLEAERTVGHDGVIRYAGQELQLERSVRRRVPDGTRVIVREAETGRLVVVHRTGAGDRLCAWHPAPPRPEALRTAALTPSPPGPRRATRPRRDHPWRKEIHRWCMTAIEAKAAQTAADAAPRGHI